MATPSYTSTYDLARMSPPAHYSGGYTIPPQSSGSSGWKNALGTLGKIGTGVLDFFTGGLASPIGSLLGGLFGYNSQEKINEQNIAMQRETNALNYQMFREQQDYNTSMYERQLADEVAMWNMNNEYNSAENQMKRYEDAGLNPVLMMQNGGGNASSAPSTPSMQSPAPPTAVAPHIDTSPMLSALSAINDTSSILQAVHANSELIERVKGLKIDNKNKQSIINQSTRSMESQIKQLDIANNFQLATQHIQQMQMLVDLQKSYGEVILSRINVNQQQLILQAMPQNLALDLMAKSQDLVIRYLQGDLTREQIRTQIASTYEKYANINKTNKEAQLVDEKITTEVYNQNKILHETSAIQADNKVKWAISDAVINATIAEMDSNASLAQLASLKANNEFASRTSWNGYNPHIFLDAVNYIIEPVKGIFGVSPK